MRVANCTQNNMHKQSFGMKIELDPVTESLTTLPYRLIPRMREAIAQANPRIVDLPGDTVTLSYAGSKYNRALQATTGYLWNMTRTGMLMHIRVETTSCTTNNEPLSSALVEGAQEFAKRIGKARLV